MEANLPSKTELLILDALIIFLQIILVCISYETSLAMALPVDTIDPLLPDNIGMYSLYPFQWPNF